MSLGEILELPRLTSVADIGANPIDGEPPYRKLQQLGLCTIIGFEPQADAFETLQRTRGPRETYLPHAVGDGGTHELHICHARGMSSLLEPDPQMLRLFNGFTDFGRVIRKEKVQTRRLDDLGLPEIDLLKMDVQGSELSILENGRETLRNVAFVHVEASFVPLYKNQPVFWQIDKELRDQGFMPHTFDGIKQWSIAPFLINQEPGIPLRQMLEADIVYCRNFARAEMMTASQWKQLAVIALHCYNSADLALHAVRMLVRLGALPDSTPERLMKNLTSNQSGMTCSIGPLPAED